MKYLVYIVIVILLLALNIGLFGQYRLFGQIPNLLLLLVIYFALDKKGHDFFFISFVCGLFLDFYSTSFFGGYTLAFLLLATSLYLLAGSFVVLELNWKSLSFLLLGSLFLLKLVLFSYAFLVYKFNWAADYAKLNFSWISFIAEYAYNLLLLYPAYIIFSLLKRSLENYYTKKRGVIG
jgi:rod shape-determining protein MreD